MSSTVVIKNNKSGMSAFLDPNTPLEQLLEDVARKLGENAKFQGSVQVTLTLEGRGLTPEKEFQIIGVIAGHSQIEVLYLLDKGVNRIKEREKALNEKLMKLSSTTSQFFRGNLREGESLELRSSIVIIGDVGKDAKVTAKRNMVVLGHLMGSVTAGVVGNGDAVIVVFEMAPTQLRIADYAGKSQSKGKKFGREPMMACVENNSICIKNIKKNFFSMLKSI